MKTTHSACLWQTLLHATEWGRRFRCHLLLTSRINSEQNKLFGRHLSHKHTESSLPFRSRCWGRGCWRRPPLHPAPAALSSAAPSSVGPRQRLWSPPRGRSGRLLKTALTTSLLIRRRRHRERTGQLIWTFIRLTNTEFVWVNVCMCVYIWEPGRRISSRINPLLNHDVKTLTYTWRGENASASLCVS